MILLQYLPLSKIKTWSIYQLHLIVQIFPIFCYPWIINVRKGYKSNRFLFNIHCNHPRHLIKLSKFKLIPFNGGLIWILVNWATSLISIESVGLVESRIGMICFGVVYSKGFWQRLIFDRIWKVLKIFLDLPNKNLLHVSLVCRYCIRYLRWWPL